MCTKGDEQGLQVRSRVTSLVLYKAGKTSKSLEARRGKANLDGYDSRCRNNPEPSWPLLAPKSERLTTYLHLKLQFLSTSETLSLNHISTQIISSNKAMLAPLHTCAHMALPSLQGYSFSASFLGPPLLPLSQGSIHGPCISLLGLQQQSDSSWLA